MTRRPIVITDMQSVTSETAERANYVVCYRTVDMPPGADLRGSYQCPCVSCEEPLTVSLRSPQRPPKICLQCAEEIARRQ